jgi:hypothetical protein
MAKGRDHKILRVLDTHLKAVPWTTDTEFCVVGGLQVECKDICHPAQPNALLLPCFLCGPFYKLCANKSRVVRL